MRQIKAAGTLALEGSLFIPIVGLRYGSKAAATDIVTNILEQSSLGKANEVNSIFLKQGLRAPYCDSLTKT